MANPPSTPEFQFFVHETVFAEVKADVQDEVILSRATAYKTDSANVFQDVNLKWNEKSVYSVIVMPGTWLKNAFPVPADIQARINQGSVRLVFWNVDEDPKACTVPATFVPLECGEFLKKILLSHVCRYPSWGVQTLLPPKSKILTERINSEKQIARKIEQSLAFICKNNPAFANQGLPLRLAMTGSFSAALSAGIANPALKTQQKPAVFQIGQCEDAVVFSLRWKTAVLDFASWQNANLRWQAIFHESLSGVVQVSVESQEIEVLLAFPIKSETANKPLWLQNHPLIFDILTTERLRVAAGLTNDTEHFAFNYFEIEEHGEAPTEFVAAAREAMPIAPTPGAAIIQEKAAPAKENSQLELTGLRVEYQKLEKQLKSSQEQASESNRKMSQTIEAEKVAQAQIKTLTMQLEKMKISMANQATQNTQELNVLKTRLESAKQKEQELVKKLTQALDQLKQSKTGQQRAS